MKKKYLTKKKAIELCVELWTWLARTGKNKDEWPGWEKYGQYCISSFNSFAMNKCWFCEYDAQATSRYSQGFERGCFRCPLYKQLWHCMNSLCYYQIWTGAKTKSFRKKYAKLFLKQIKSLRVK